jgi:hypothetical protein
MRGNDSWHAIVGSEKVDRTQFMLIELIEKIPGG